MKNLYIYSIILIIFITYYKNNNFEHIELKNKNNFDDILPRIEITEIPKKSEIFKSRQIYITDTKLTKEYINYIRPRFFIEEDHINNKYEGIEPDLSFINNRTQQIEINKFYDLCYNEKTISNETFFNRINDPLISVLIISYNKGDTILKSIRSIQNQSLKNIEIIIVNDCSTDDSKEIFDELLKTDQRIRVFNHLKNMGVWRSRLDGFLYSNAPYVIHFDAGDYYADNYVLEDIYNIASKYKLDSVRFGFRLTREKDKLSINDSIYTFNKRDLKIVYGNRHYSVYGYKYGTIWNRLTKSSVFTKGLYYLDEYILNAYKNIYDDRWWNALANNASHSYLMTNRIGYIYLRNSKGEGHIKSGNEEIKEKSIKEVILFSLFDYNLAYIKSDKSNIINDLRNFYKGQRNIKLSDLNSYFPPYNHLLEILIKDKYVSNRNKQFLLYLKHHIKYYK